MQTEKSQPDGKRMMSEMGVYRLSGIICLLLGLDFSVGIKDQWLLYFLPLTELNRIIPLKIYNLR